LVGINEDLFEENSLKFTNLSSWAARPYDNLVALNGYSLNNNLIILNVSSRIFMLKDSTCYNFSPNRIFNLLDFKLHKQIQQFSDDDVRSIHAHGSSAVPHGILRANPQRFVASDELGPEKVQVSLDLGGADSEGTEDGPKESLGPEESAAPELHQHGPDPIEE
jgi:hypothetical protein